MTADRFQPDCRSCVGLCCILFAFPAGDDFPEDKPAQVACRHLSGSFDCKIHAWRRQHGYHGCERFDCHGAGQVITRDLLGGRPVADRGPETTEIWLAFRRLVRARRQAQLLDLAGALPLDRGQLATRDRLAARALPPAPGWSAASLTAFDIVGFEAAVSGFLRSLRALVSDTGESTKKGVAGLGRTTPEKPRRPDWG